MSIQTFGEHGTVIHEDNGWVEVDATPARLGYWIDHVRLEVGVQDGLYTTVATVQLDREGVQALRQALDLAETAFDEH